MTDEDKWAEKEFDTGERGLPEVIKALITPGLHEQYPELLSQDWTLSNITTRHEEIIMDAADLAYQFKMIGATHASNFLGFVIISMLSVRRSIGGFERLAQQTNVRHDILEESKKGSTFENMFKRQGGDK